MNPSEGYIHNPFEQDALVVTTYDFAVEKAAYIEKLNWDLAIFDEASCLSKSYTGENKTASTLKKATGIPSAGCFYFSAGIDAL